MKRLLLSTAAAMLLASPSMAQELRVALSSMVTSLDAQQATGNDGAPILYLVYDTLIERDPEAVPLQYRPGCSATIWMR